MSLTTAMRMFTGDFIGASFWCGAVDKFGYYAHADRPQIFVAIDAAYVSPRHCMGTTFVGYPRHFHVTADALS